MKMPIEYSVTTYFTVSILYLCWIGVYSTADTKSNTNSNSTPEKFIAAYSNHRLAANFLLSLYQNLSNGLPLNQATGRPKNWENIKYADTVRTFPAIDVYGIKHQVVYKFNMSQIGPDEELQVAELRVQVPQEWNKKNELKALAVIMDGNSFIDMSSISFVTTRLASEEILIIDFTSALSDWLEFVRKNHLEDKLTLDIAFKIGNRRKSSSSSRSKLLGQVRRIRSENSNTLEAILVTYTQAGDLFGKTKSVREFNKQNEPIIPPASLDINAPKMDDDAVSGDRIQLRSKRSNFDVSDNGHENGYNCRRKELTIDFTAMGWGEWVVYPTHFNSYQCTGKCGGFTESRNNPTNHAIVQSLVRLISRNAIPMSCCTPTKLSPLSILYLEKGSVVIKHHEEMIVDECGCM